MAAIGSDSHSMPRWVTTPLAASAASFHPSKAHRATGLVSGPTSSLNLMVPPPVPRGTAASTYSLRLSGGRSCNTAPRREAHAEVHFVRIAQGALAVGCNGGLLCRLGRL